MRSYILFFILITLLHTKIAKSQTTYCHGSVCSQVLSVAENEMKLKTEMLGDKLVYNYTQYRKSDNLRWYFVPVIPASSAGVELNLADLDDFIGWGHAQCNNSLNITRGSWVYQGLVSVGSGIMAYKYERSVGISIEYGLVVNRKDYCAQSSANYVRVDRKYDNYSCDEGYSIGYADDDSIVCESKVRNIVQELECEAPFAWNSNEQSCITYCPENSTFDESLGRCEVKKDETPQCDAQKHNPIDTSTGEKRQAFTDFQQNTALPLTFSRNYGSLRAPSPKITYQEKIDSPNKVKITQPAGYSTPNIGWSQSTETQKQGHVQWRHNYQITLVKYNGEDIAITLADMTRRIFSYNETSLSYVTDFPNGDSLQASTDGWLYTDNNQTQYQFDLAGQLVTISNAFNESLLLSYDANNKLSTITNNQNESLTYTYSADGLLTAVTQPDGNIINLTYDDYNNLSAVTYPDETTGDLTDNPSQTYHYENSTQPYALTGITDENGVRFATWEYNDIGQAINSSHALNTQAGTVEYDNANRSIVSTNSLGNATSITFDEAGRVSKVVGASCSTSGEKGVASFTYNSQGQVESHTDESNAVTYKTYETSGLAKGKVNKIVELYGTENAQSTEMLYESDNVKPTQITHPSGLVEHFVYGINSRLESHTLTTDSETRTTTYGYNPEGLLASIDGSRLDVSDLTTFTYSDGRITERTNALGHTTRFANYDAFGNATQITDHNGVVNHLTYDVRGRLTRINKADRVSLFEYDAIGLLVKVTEPSGSYLKYSYDEARRLTDITNNLGERIHFELDSEGNVIRKEVSESDANILFSQTFVYDQLNRLSQTVSATSQVWENEYDVAGNVIKQISPASTDIQSTFDQLKRVSEQLAQDESATGYEYNELNQLTKVTDALGRETTYQYNQFGELINQVSQDSDHTTFTYDLAGNLATQTDARGVVTTYNYDALNRVTFVSHVDVDSNNVTIETAFIYDNADINRHGIGQLTRVERAFDSVDLYYNSYGELIKEVTVVNLQAENPDDMQTYTTEYTYTLDGQLSSITYPSKRVVTYMYNDIGAISQVTTESNGALQVLAENIDYLPFGGMQSLTYGNGKVLTQTYNQNYQLTDKVIDNVLSKTYVYDPVNNIDTITDNLIAAQSESFTYSNVNRLTQAVGLYGDLSYDYDAIGNRLSNTTDDGSNVENTQYVYQNDSQLTSLTGAINTEMEYNERGDLVRKGDDLFTYNNEARLSSALVNNTATSYQYNYRGQRIAKLFDNGEYRYYVYDQQGLLVAELNHQAETQIEYVYLNGQRIAILNTTKNEQEYYLINKETGFKLRADWRNEGSVLRVGDAADESDWVKFTKESSVQDYFYFTNVETGHYFRPANLNDDADIEQRKTTYRGKQTQWRLLPAANDAYYIQNRRTEGYLQAPMTSIGDKATINQANTDLSASWLVTPVTEQPTSNTDVYYVHTSHLDTPLALTDDNGAVAWQANYTPFGGVTVTLDTLPESFTARFPGQYSDTETGLYYNYFRDYDPELGRYIQSDPIGLAGGINTYGYVGGNPLSYVDPLGLSSIYFNNEYSMIRVYDGDGLPVSSGSATNNAASNSNGPWSSGTYPYSHWSPHSMGTAKGRYGSNGNFVFDVPNRSGMGVHSGREGQCDKANRCDESFATMGCIRTTDEMTNIIRNLHFSGDPLTTITVE